MAILRIALLVLLVPSDAARQFSSAAESPAPADAPAVTPEDHAARLERGGELFKVRIAELLKQRCLDCHGGKKTEGAFDLATRQGLLAGGSAGPAVTLWKGDESLLVKLVARSDEPGMPYEQDPLPAADVADLKRWIDDGAAYDAPLIDKPASPKGKPTVDDADRAFWSFQPLAKCDPPRVRNQAWVQTPIDRYVLSKLEAAGIVPNDSAARGKLIRRASLDLLGLPPTAAQVEAFAADSDPNAYEKLIDRLLASPHYGERWGRHWLDLARFAESHGYEQDYDRPSAYHYRDFVIRALNDDMPYDKFVSWQIAGDELAPDDPQAMMATGYLGAGTHATQITANQVEKERYDELDDMTATAGTSLLGLTVGCARCHDHKFDPIPTRDYYRLLSSFTTAVRSEPELDLNPAATAERLRAWQTERDELSGKLADFEQAELPGRLRKWLATKPALTRPAWRMAAPVKIASAGGATFAPLPDGSYLASGANADFDVYTLDCEIALPSLGAVRIEALAHESMIKSGPGRADNGNFDLTDFKLAAAYGDPAAQAAGNLNDQKLTAIAATFEQPGLSLVATVDGDEKSGWAIDPQFGKNHAAAYRLDAPLSAQSPGAPLRVKLTLRFNGNTRHNIGRLRVAFSESTEPALAGEPEPSAPWTALAEVLSESENQWRDEQLRTLGPIYRRADADYEKLLSAVEAHALREPKPALTKVMVVSEGLPAIRLHTQGADFFEKTFVLRRGDLTQKQEEATQGFLQVLMRGQTEQHWISPPPAGARTSHRRTALAKWLTDVDFGAGPLLARVAVNRLWQHHFGRGLVATPSDFGKQGEKPTHPELLEYLSSELVRGGWRLKPLHRLIMTSAAYRQTAAFDDARAAVDPQNKMLWRREIHRLEAETIRDAMLAVSGTLDASLFGPGTLDANQRRRSIYFTVKRSQLVPLMTLFDAPDALQGLGLRGETIVAPQALALMNNDQMRAFAKAFAGRVRERYDQSPREAVDLALQIALARPAEKQESQDYVAFLEEQAKRYRDGGRGDAVELALTDLCGTIFSLNEFIYVD